MIARACKEGNMPRSEDSMTDYSDYEPILAVIEAAMDKARKNPKRDQPTPSDDYVAWVVLQELRRSGWTISRNPNPGDLTA
jgi:hypothetical protein